MAFLPIAIVGTGCALPGALDPQSLWRIFAEGRSALTPLPDGRWRVPGQPPASVQPADGAEHPASDVGGYVTGFDEVFDPNGFALAAREIVGLDRGVLWCLHAGRQALGTLAANANPARCGLVMGNLSIPSTSLAELAQEVWRGRQPSRSESRNRFCSSLPATLTARALGLGAGAFALDAACASALYAVKGACDRLHDRTADLMVAGGVNAADNLFVHTGFTALQALSATGRSRPFDRAADGLVPAEGAVFVALMRLEDALSRDTPILGVIRGIGLSNDGRGRGLLTPTEEGQIRAMRQAYEQAGLDPCSVTLLECHATGTPVGDAVEVGSSARIFDGIDDLPLGSAKSNLGHLITAAGGVGLLKVLGAISDGIRPPTLGVDEPIAPLAGSPLRLLTQAEEWTGPRRAAVSAFGFGGNNAHLIVDTWDDHAPAPVAPVRRPEVPRVAIVALGARVGDGEDAARFARDVLTASRAMRARSDVEIDLAGLRFPPQDLSAALAQQSLLLEAVREAAARIRLPRERTQVLVSMECDPEAARYCARWRNPSLPSQARDAISPPLTAVGVLGIMPNVVANRINSQLDLAGPGYTISSSETSGLVALDLAARAIREGEADAAVVAGVDLSCEPVHRASLAALGRDLPTGDAAVALVLKKADLARRHGERILAVIEPQPEAEALRFGNSPSTPNDFDPGALFGTAHAACGLVAAAAGVIAIDHGAQPRLGRAADPWLGARRAQLTVTPWEGTPATIALREDSARSPWLAEPAPRLHVYSGAHVTDLLHRLDRGEESREGPARLVLIAANRPELHERAEATKAWLSGRAGRPEGAYYRNAPLAGDLAFVYTGGAAAYPGMGRELALALPGVVEALEERAGPLRESIGWLYDGTEPDMLGRLLASSFLCHLHTDITRDLLKLTPSAAIGYSSGEANALTTLGAWPDLRSLIRDVNASSLFTRELSREYRAVLGAWQRLGVEGDRWQSHLVGASPEKLRAALDGEPGAHLGAVNSPESCMLAGEATACARVLARLNPEYAIELDYDVAVHAPELQEVRTLWHDLHHRETHPVPGVRFYTCGSTDSYTPTSDSAADALTTQALGTIDFRATVEKAWADGIRVFVEHGPRSLCTDWIESTLAGREHLAVALDPPEGGGIRAILSAAAQLITAGVPIDEGPLLELLEGAQPTARATPAGTGIVLPAHPPAVRIPEMPAQTNAAPPVPADPQGSQIPAAIERWRRAVADIHREYLDAQSTLHQRFLTLRRQGSSLLGFGCGPFAPTPQPSPVAKSGPVFDRAALERLATGRISELFGPAFAAQDGYPRQTRMPAPPLLLADRVTAIDAVPTSMGRGTICTETDVRPDSWYLDPTGRMPAGLMIEAGQADLLLISWLGVDLATKGERVYRLLGAELTYHGSPPRPGETLDFEITIDGHAEQSGVRLFFFHYDCRVDGRLRLSVRHGQAGFFTDEELAYTGGVLWDQGVDLAVGDVAPAPRACIRTSFDEGRIRAFAEGCPAECFGPGWEATRAHVRTPRIPVERLLLIGKVTDFDPRGGPHGGGYLRAELPLSPDSWFFDGHFHHDPCMPGTLMFEGCLQAMSFFLAATGHTLKHDGWRFEPVPGTPIPMRCRGQATPASELLVYEVFVTGLTDAPEPTLVADVLCTVDGVKAFHAQGVALRLVPDWPLGMGQPCPAAARVQEDH